MKTGSASKRFLILETPQQVTRTRVLKGTQAPVESKNGLNLETPQQGTRTRVLKGTQFPWSPRMGYGRSVSSLKFHAQHCSRQKGHCFPSDWEFPGLRTVI